MKLTFENYVQTGNDGYPVAGEGLRVEWNDIAVEFENDDPTGNVWFVLTTLANVADLRTSDRRSVAVWATLFDRQWDGTSGGFTSQIWPESGATTVEYAETGIGPQNFQFWFGYRVDIYSFPELTRAQALWAMMDIVPTDWIWLNDTRYNHEREVENLPLWTRPPRAGGQAYPVHFGLTIDGLGAGLSNAEYFRLLNRGNFSHRHVYRPDATLGGGGRLVAPGAEIATDVAIPRVNEFDWRLLTIEEHNVLILPPDIADVGAFITVTKDEIRAAPEHPTARSAVVEAYDHVMGPVRGFQETIGLINYDTPDAGGQVNVGTIRLIGQLGISYGIARLAGKLRPEQIRNAIETQALKWVGRAIPGGLIGLLSGELDWAGVARTAAKYLPEVDIGIDDTGVRIDITAPDDADIEADCRAILEMTGFEELVEECGQALDQEIVEQTLAEVPDVEYPAGGAGWLLELLEERKHGYIN